MYKLLVLVILFVLPSVFAATCTVGSYIGADYVSLSDAIINCGGGGLSEVDLVLTNETYNETMNGLLLPATLTNFTMRIDPFDTPYQPDVPKVCPPVANDCKYLYYNDSVINATVALLGNASFDIFNCSQYFPDALNCTLLNATLLANATNCTIDTCVPEILRMAHILLPRMVVLNESATLNFYGIWFDMQGANNSLTLVKLVDNNFTLDRCLLYENHGNTTIEIEACGCKTEIISVKAISSRFKHIWGSALSIKGVWDYWVENNTLDRCGGFNNHSCLDLHHTPISRGNSILRDNSHWLLANQQPPLCRFGYDPDGMAKCVDGIPYCYSQTLTAQTETCELVNTTYLDTIANETKTILDYDRRCRIYQPCECASVMFIDPDTSVTYMYQAGDLYYYTGLHLHCIAFANATLDPIGNKTFVQSLAGDIAQPGGIFGGAPPTNETGWNIGILPLSGTFIILLPANTTIESLFVPENATYFPGNNTYTLDGNISFPLIRQLDANSSANFTIVQGTCWCNESLLNTSLANITGCLYNIPNENSTVFQTMPGVLPNNSAAGLPYTCNNGTLYCCNGTDCTTQVPCTCPYQPNYFTEYNQSALYNTSEITSFITAINTSNTIWNAGPQFSVPDSVTMIAALLSLVAPNDTALFSDVLTTAILVIGSDYSCLFNGTCPLPLLPPYDLKANLTCDIATSTLQCPCDDFTLLKFLIPYFSTIGNTTSAIRIRNIPDEMASYTISGLRTQQLYVGLRVERTTHARIVADGLYEPWWFDRQAVLREIWRRDNSFINGTLHDLAYNQEDAQFYEEFCDGGCRLPFRDIDDFISVNTSQKVCIVDNAAGEPLPSNYYTTVQDATNACCRSIVVVGRENYYVENLLIGSCTRQIYSFNEAVIVGVHKLDKFTDNLEVRGMHLYHPGDISTPLFTRDGGANNITILNCLLNGNGASGAGIFGQQLDPINYVTINYTRIENWNILGLQLWNVQQFDFHHNLAYRVWGRMLDVEYTMRFGLTHISLVDVRGARQLKGVPMIALRQRIGSQEQACANNTFLPCTMIDIIQNVDVTSEDQNDICYYLQRGNIPVGFIRDLQCVKAAKGFVADSVASINRTTLPTLVLNNPLIRPSNFPVSLISNAIALNTGGVGITNDNVAKKVNKRIRISDFQLKVYFLDPFFGNYFSAVENIACNFPCVQVLGEIAAYNVCEVNDNYDIGYARQYGWKTFHNYSQAIDFCRATNATNQQQLEYIPILGTGWGGARLMRDQITVRFPVSIRSDYVALDLPPIELFPPNGACWPRSVVYGVGHLLIANPINITDMEFRADDQDTFGLDLMRTNPSIIAVTNITITRTTFNFRNQVAASPVRALNLVMGVDYNQTEELFEERNRGGEKKKPKKAPTQTVLLDMCIFRNFYAYEQTRVVDGEQEEILSVGFPFTDPMYIYFLNERDSKAVEYNELNITNCVFERVDRRAIDAKFWDYAFVNNNTFIDCGGRSPDTVGVVLFKGNIKRGSSLHMNFTFNTLWQSQEVLFPETAEIRFQYSTAFWLDSFPLGSRLCIRNNSASDLSVALRLTGANFTSVLQNCIYDTEVPDLFVGYTNDMLRKLYYLGNQALNGTVWDMTFCEPFRDFDGTCAICNNGCLPPPPDECSVSLTNATHVPSHPYYGIYYFNDINLALETCNLSLVRVDPNTPYTPYITTINPQFPPGHAALNGSKITLKCQGPIGAPLEDGTLFGNNIIRGSGPNTTIIGCGHRLDLGMLRVENCIFEHSSTCTVGTATWEQFSSVMNPEPLLLEFVGTEYRGGGTPSRAITGIFDNGFLLQQSNFTTYNGDQVVYIVGRNCSVNVTATFNHWTDVRGAALHIEGVASYHVLFTNVSEGGCKVDTFKQAVIYVAQCPTIDPTRSMVEFRQNTVTHPTSGTLSQPRGDNRYCSAFYIDNLDDTQATIMPFIVDENYARSIGAGMVLDNNPNPCPRTDRQEHLRYYALSQGNIQVQGEWHWLVWIKNPGDPEFAQTTIDTNPEYYKCHWCDNGCSIPNELILMYIIAAFLFILFLLFMYRLFCDQRPFGPRFYYSSVVNMPIPIDAQSMWGFYGFDPDRVLTENELADRKR